MYSVYCKQRIVYLRMKGLKTPTITRILKERESLPMTRVGIHEFLKRFEETGCLMRRPGSGRPSKMTIEVKRVVEQQMRLNDGMTTTQLHALLVSKGYRLSLKTILRCRSSLG